MPTTSPGLPVSNGQACVQGGKLSGARPSLLTAETIISARHDAVLANGDISLHSTFWKAACGSGAALNAPARMRRAASRAAPSIVAWVPSTRPSSTVASSRSTNGGPTSAHSTAARPLSSRSRSRSILIGMHPAGFQAPRLPVPVFPEPVTVTAAVQHALLILPPAVVVIAVVGPAARRMLPDDLRRGAEVKILDPGQLQHRCRDRRRRRHGDDRLKRIAHAHLYVGAGRARGVADIEVALHARPERRGRVVGRTCAERQCGIVERRL